MSKRMDSSEDAIRFIYTRIKDFKNPEHLEMWAEWAKIQIGYKKPAHALYNAILRRLQKIEKLRGFTLKEKAHLLFTFSVPLSLAIAEELNKENWTYDLDEKQRIKFFTTEEGVVYKAIHTKSEKWFKGVKLNDKQNTSDIDGCGIETARVQDDSHQMDLHDVFDTETIPEQNESENSQKISLHQWILQIEKFANKLQMSEEFQTKAKKAVVVLSETDEIVPYRDFNDIFRVCLRSITRDSQRIEHGPSLNLQKLLMQIGDHLEKSFEYESMRGAMEVIREECEKLGEEVRKISINTLQTKIDAMMSLLSKTWAECV
ncbi:hypothetical protein B9Z55_010305 [Caenorhabditis nigoni]|uniref:SPK domain-containing protein n=2 Tax=Caenorhabditis nigoni TaxID=1611254 RepID=A0A2G5UFB2_9PELO|nr:hypothetical protein B9Z55_010305 [Caenorhabditis nigoni]